MDKEKRLGWRHYPNLWERRDFALRKLGFASYADYLRSEHWRTLKERFRKSGLWNGGFCAVCCQLRPLEIHHKTYKRIGREYLGDLVALCAGCHERTHEVHGTKTMSLWKSHRALAKDLKRIRRGREPKFISTPREITWADFPKYAKFKR